MIASRLRVAAAIATVTALVGCATHRAPLAVIAPPVAAIPPRPTPPAVVAGNFVTPPKGPDGNYVTINRGLTPDEMVWQLRAALNVAALGCSGPNETMVVPAYNALLASQKAALATAYKAVQAQHKARWGTGWQDQHDQRMTRVYNFFSQIQAKQAFCTAATDVLTRTAAIAPGGLATFAAGALPELEAPFTTFYANWDRYRIELAAWDQHYGPNADPALRYAAPAPAATPQIADATVAAPAVAAVAAPKLGYAPMADVFAWQPRSITYAANDIRGGRIVIR